jgi:hypothetical protein
MAKLIVGLILIAFFVLLGHLSAAVGDSKSLMRGEYLNIEYYWPLAAMALLCLCAGIALISFAFFKRDQQPTKK